MFVEIKNHGHKIKEIRLTSKNGQIVSFLNVGATLYRWVTLQKREIVARYDNIDDYLTNQMSFGTTVGMNSGRIENGEFVLEGVKYRTPNKETHFLHGGEDRLSLRFFDFELFQRNDGVEIIFTHEYSHSILPGTQLVSVKYLVKENDILVTYDVTTDKTGLCNLTNHTYFNLDGDFLSSIDHHEIQIPASKVVIVDDEMIGKKVTDVEGTDFDFRVQKDVYKPMQNVDSMFPKVKGIDHYFLLDHPCSKLYSRKTKTLLKVKTTLPGVTVYTTNYPNQEWIQTKKPLGLHHAICLEPQYQSNAINDHRFEVGIVTVKRPYHHEIEYTLEENVQ